MEGLIRTDIFSRLFGKTDQGGLNVESPDGI